MKIIDVLKPFIDELSEFLKYNGKNEQEAIDENIDGTIYIMIDDEYIAVDMNNSYWYHEDDGAIVFRVNDMTECD